mmetsp:Transcript_108239/g.258341  ORF Transcript_108239/g.258341 Transcript_108239/m.258341 type:complete len:83 (+) Transcript_108239:77-325(+)
MMLFRLLMVMLLTVAAKDFLAKKENATESADAAAGATDLSITEGNLTLRTRVCAGLNAPCWVNAQCCSARCSRVTRHCRPVR